ncbi:Coenzyme F420 hydrogenase/dehydrogenase, beta subunit C-terminal domain [Gracilibacillus lacisalsi]|uniref:Coenzyme F420 hydrogenase/dehydrogenase, beta subunit C-terminal domain n=1 Tax=Gracilibacillus lacisalsi TaxID=393087 RepID=UPI000372DBD3|nr:Coenzyme F420 hydrogenase/dehydrogenase, beta subunit C-terminal domain [Gracilibacillus lacisalsi]
MNSNVKELLDTVVSNDYCIGCGICASVYNSPLSMEMDDNGKYKPVINNNIEAEKEIEVLSVCPFSKESKNETEIGSEVFSRNPEASFNEYTGYFIKNFAGYVKEGEYRSKGSSGGMGSWVAAQLLKNDLVDGIIHIKPSKEEKKLFEYSISYNEGELSNGAKSKYYPIELSEVVNFVRKHDKRFALVGIPCYIKSVRLLADQDVKIKNSIKYFIGLVCGHLKSDMFAKSIGWQLGIKPENLINIDFRKKLAGRSANQYGVEVQGNINGEIVTKSSPTKELYTTNWGHGFFKYNACDFCDDVLAETADITIGDAWLPEYLRDSQGTNVIVVRNPDILNIINDNKDQLFLNEISTDKVYKSQAGGFRHRREGLAYRLFLKDMNKEWRPTKRVEPNDKLSSKRKKIYIKRQKLVQESFKAYKIAEDSGDFNTLIKHMDPFIKDYNKDTTPFFLKKMLKNIKKMIKDSL